MKIKTKVKGFMSFNAVLLCLVALMAGYSLLQIYGSQFSALSASRKALQAQQFAQSEADLLRNTSYDELDAAAHDRQSISGVNGWMSEVSIEAETTINEVPQRLATVKVYRNGTVTAPDFSLKVPLSSAGESGGGEAIGSIVARPSDRFTSPTEAARYLFCDGSTFSTSAYPKLYQVLGTTTLPDLRERFLEGLDTPNTYIEAGLPNITGMFEMTRTNSARFSGAFKRVGFMSTVSCYTHELPGMIMNFDASWSNPIYGKSITVQPPAYTVRYYIRAK